MFYFLGMGKAYALDGDSTQSGELPIGTEHSMSCWSVGLPGCPAEQPPNKGMKLTSVERRAYCTLAAYPQC